MEAAEAVAEIREIREGRRKREIAREILEALPDWFGIPEAREAYIADSEKQIFFAAMENGSPKGFLCLKETGKNTVELAVMGVLKELHRQGIGRRLFLAARERARNAGYSFLQVKTVEMGHYREYDATNQFYLSLGFREFEVFPTLWDEWNPCQIYVMYLGEEDLKYWDTVWDIKDIEKYRQYIKGYENVKNGMVREFQKNNCHIVCDGACGFGANSLILQSNGFDVWGFDISEDAVRITKELLAPYGIRKEQFKTASLMNTGYPDDFFDAVAVRAAMDHLRTEEFERVMGELRRITKENGLLYVSFDTLEQDDTELEHIVLEDGSFLYTDESRRGLLFHYYSDEEIQNVFRGCEILDMETDAHGNRHLIIRF